VTIVEVTAGERAAWQRPAALELAAILETHRDLPAIAWTVAAAGATLVGQVSGPGSAGRVAQVFDLWRAALMLTEHYEITVAAGGTYLRAAADRRRVRVRLTATVHAGKPNGVSV
jgi:hypothetical protein